MLELLDPGRLRRAAAELRRKGRLAEASRLFKRAVELAPADPQGWAELVDCLLADRRPALALEVCGVGLRSLPADVGLLCTRARVWQSLSRVEAARMDFQRVLALEPGNAQASFGLALQAVEAGDWDGAATAAAALPALGARSDWLTARIALGRAEFGVALANADRARRANDLSPDQLAEAELLAGEALDGLGRPSEAFEAFRRGKGVLRAFYAERAASRESELARLRRLADWFRAADPAPWRNAPAGAPASGVRGHAFLVGFPRSGTTLLEQALAGHAELAALEEPPTLAEASDEFLATPAGLERLAGLTAQEAEHWRAVYWRVAADHGVNVGDAAVAGKAFLDKAPAGTFCLPLIARLFPEAKVLFAVRDPRDVVLSCFRNSFQMNALTYAFTDLDETARCYAAVMELAAVYREKLPLRPIEVRYERLVDDFAGELGRIAAFVGLDLTPAMLDVAATAGRRVVRTPSAPQVRAGLNRQGIGRWRAYAAQLAPVMPILAPWIERLGYGGDG